jgi:hypothetical protein
MFAYYDAQSMELIPGEPECLKWFKSKSPTEEARKALFLYRSQATGKFMLGAWVMVRGIFNPLLEIGSALSDFNQKTISTYLSIMYPQHQQTMQDGLRKAADNHKNAAENFDAERIENRARLLRNEFGIPARRADGTVLLPPEVLAG